MKRLLVLLVVIFLWPATARAVVSLCAISGQVFNPDGSTLNNGTVQFNSQVTQVVGSTTIPPSIISTTTDANGNMAAMSVAQGLFGTFTFCQGHTGTNVGGPGGGCSAAINGLIPINTTANIQSIIAGTLLPSVGNATVNNLTATNNVNVGGTMQTQTLLVNGNSTLTGNATVGGTLTTTGAMTAPSLSLTQNTCSALTLAGGIIASAPPYGGMNISSGAHCAGGSGSSNWTADANSAVIFANYNNLGAGVGNAGWQWTGNSGLTPGSTFTPTLLMSVADTPALSATVPHYGTLSTNSLVLWNGSSTAIQLAGGSIASVGNPNMNYQMGAHYNGSAWLADATTAAAYSQFNASPGVPMHEWLAASGLTVGGGVPWSILGQASLNGWTMNGTNPVAILQSNTNANADILEVLPQNQTQGQALLWSGIHSIGSNSLVPMNIDAKGSGAINLNSNNTSGSVAVFSYLTMANNNHLIAQLNGGPAPSVSSCTPAAAMRGGSTDVSGQVVFSATGGTSNCLINFGSAWPNAPNCVCSLEEGNGLSEPCGTNTSTTQLNLQSQAQIVNTSFAQINYICIGI